MKVSGEKITAWLKFIGKALEKLATIIDFVRSQLSDLQVPGRGGSIGGAGTETS